MKKILTLFIVLLLSSFSHGATKSTMLSFNEIIKLNKKTRHQYLKVVAKQLVRIDTEKEMKTSWLEVLGLYTTAHAEAYRCIGGGVPIPDTASRCGAREYAGFSCPSGYEICNPFIFGVKSETEPVCFRNATTEKCYKETSPGVTTFTDPVFNKDGAREAYENFKKQVDDICDNGASIAESSRERRKACQKIRRQTEINKQRDLNGFVDNRSSEVADDWLRRSQDHAFARAASEGPLSFGPEYDSELGGGRDIMTYTGNPADYPLGGDTGDIPGDYFQGGDPEAKGVFGELHAKFKNNPKLRRSQKALQMALAFYARNRNAIPSSCGGDLGANNRRGAVAPVNKIDNQRYIMVVDYTIPLPQDRMFVLDTQTGSVRSSPAAHGYGSNRPISKCPRSMRVNCGSRGTKCRIPVNMGNTDGSGKTSRGFYVTDSGYRSGQSTFRGGSPASRGNNALQLRGLQSGVNSNALSRDVVFHRASYYQNTCSSSAGCPAINPALFEDIKGELGRSMMYIHTIDDEGKEEPEC